MNDKDVSYRIEEELYEELQRKIGLVPLREESYPYMQLDSFNSGGTESVYSIVIRQTPPRPDATYRAWQSPRGIKIL